MKLWQRKLFANSVHVCMILADTKLYIPINLMAVTGNPRDFTIIGTLQKIIYTLPDIFFIKQWTITGLQDC